MYIKKILLLIVALSVVVGGIFSYYVYSQIFNPNTNFSEANKSVYISKNDSPQMVLNTLKPLVKDVASLDWLAKKKAYYKYIKPGHYVIPKGSNNNDIITILRSKNTPISISFNNQERLENLAGRVAQQLDTDSLALVAAFRDKDFLKQHNFTTETALSMYIPNKYEFFWNTSAVGFRDRMLKEYQAFWNNNRKAKAEKIGLTPTEVYTLASIVHKETVKIDERPKVAGVYMNRLKRGMKLDADPTVIYAIKKQSGNWEQIIKRVLFKDLSLQNTYNTYQNAGLPPGPIAMPDISAIDAVLNYQNHNYLYFVADVENLGYHLFATNLTQHNQNSKKYHNWVNSKRINR